MPLDPVRLENVVPLLAELANQADRERQWPEASWRLLREAGVPGWSIPEEYGGVGLDGIELLAGYEALAGACLTTCFILSQREAACRRILDSRHKDLCRTLLPALARSETFATVGLSQLTTSRQHGKPALQARSSGRRFILDGTMPWVTGAPHADVFIIGAVTEDGKQLLAALPRQTAGVTVEPPLDLMALQGSLTSAVVCQGVHLDPGWLLAGPAETVMASGRGGTGGLETSCLALGLGGAAVAYLEREQQQRPELHATVERLEMTRRRLRSDMHYLAQSGGTPQALAGLRARANSFVLRATQAALTVSKGTGFLHSHPAQRWARQALFFLVWSCPRPAADAMLRELTCDAPAP